MTLPPATVHFARCVRATKDVVASHYDPALAKASLGLTPAQLDAVRVLLDSALTDLAYTMLMAIDGAGTLEGDLQQPYDLRNEAGERISEGASLEAAAYEALHGG